MSDSEDSGPGRREVAHRLFAAEFDDADFSYSESDEERAPNYVVTPTGARVNRLFAVGVLTELEQVNEEVLRARIVDPTGPFVVYAGQYQPEALAFLETATPPLFVAITGKARTFEPEDGDRVFTSIRPESISEVDAETRDRWVVQAAEQTVDRVARMASAKESGLSGDSLQTALTEAGVEESDASGIALALEHYGTTGDYLQAVRKLSLDAARVVAGDRDEAGTLSLSPGEGGDEPLAALAEMEIDAPEPSETATAGDGESAEADADEIDIAEGEPESTAETVSEPADAGADTDAVETTPDSTDTDEPATESVGDVDAGDGIDESGGVEDTGTISGDSEPEADSSSVESGETTAAESPTTDDTTETTGDDVEDFDPEFELDEDEREEIESEYGTDFQSGSEVDEPGEAGIETPDPEELAEHEARAAEESGATDEADTAAAGSDADATASDVGAADGDEPSAADGDELSAADTDEPSAADGDESPAADGEDVDLEDAVMDAMTELNDGSGADRDAVRETVVAEYGADPDAVDDAIQDALMGGRCYEPEDGKLTPI